MGSSWDVNSGGALAEASQPKSSDGRGKGTSHLLMLLEEDCSKQRVRKPANLHIRRLAGADLEGRAC